MKKILITGSSGYIGSHLSKMLMDTLQYEVHGLDVNEPQYPIHKFHKQDINRLFTLDEEFDTVIHLAALVRVGESEVMPIIMSCPSGRLCNAHATWASVRRRLPVRTADLIWRAIWVTGTPSEWQCGASTNNARAMSSTLRPCWIGLWKATVESM